MKKYVNNWLLGLSVVAAMGLVAAPASAMVTYTTWQSNESPNGNYIFNVTHDDANSVFNYSLTVDPWNAEALGLFIDLGDVAVGSVAGVSLTNVIPMNQVSVFATDTSSSSCGQGCNLNGLAPPPREGGDWELVFRLGSQGFDSIQTFSWTTQDFGLTESAFGIVGIRAQQLCSGTAVLPNGTCPDSDKVWGVRDDTPVIPPGGDPIPEPGILFLMGAGLLGLGMARRRKSA